jgi:hypothetical protein
MNYTLNGNKMKKLSRRTIIAGATVSSFAPKYAKANGMCPGPSFYQPFGTPICNAFIDPKRIQIADQDKSEWCWAATISNLFAYYNHRVPQGAIVDAGIGTLVNQPASVSIIHSVLNKQWTDDSGNDFASAAQILYSVDAKDPKYSIPPSNEDIIDQLEHNRPLLFCNMSHAMMLVSVNYFPPINRPSNVVASIVIDPWPGIGLRALTGPEQHPVHEGGQLRLIMRVDVT